MSALPDPVRHASLAALVFLVTACSGGSQPEPQPAPVELPVAAASPESHEGHASMHAAREPVHEGMDHEGMNHGGHAMGADTNAEPEVAIGTLDPAATLQPDSLDAAVTISVAEATKAANNVPDGDIRHVVPGEDDENPPTPQAAVRDGATRPEHSEPDHSGHEQPAATKPAGSTTGHEGHSAAKTAPSSEGKSAATIYTCPMHPEVTSDEPGTCPKCGMALVKKEMKK